jgi:hypothetical protein
MKWQLPINVVVYRHFVITYSKKFVSMIPTSKRSFDHVIAELFPFDVTMMLGYPALWNWSD